MGDIAEHVLHISDGFRFTLGHSTLTWDTFGQAALIFVAVRIFGPCHMCGSYWPHPNKSEFPFTSAPSKIMKQNVELRTFRNLSNRWFARTTVCTFGSREVFVGSPHPCRMILRMFCSRNCSKAQGQSTHPVNIGSLKQLQFFMYTRFPHAEERRATGWNTPQGLQCLSRQVNLEEPTYTTCMKNTQSLGNYIMVAFKSLYSDVETCVLVRRASAWMAIRVIMQMP